MSKSFHFSSLFLIFLMFHSIHTLPSSYLSKFRSKRSLQTISRPSSHKVSLYFNADYEILKSSQICQIPGGLIDTLYYGYLVYSAGTCTFSKPDSESYLGPAGGVCGNVAQSPTETYKGDMYQLLQFKQKFPNVKVFLTLGGPYNPNAVNLHNSMISNMNSVVNSCVGLFQKYNKIFDGFDLDLEFPCVAGDTKCGPNGVYYSPSPNDKTAFTSLISALKTQLSTAPSSLMLSSDTNKLNAINFTVIDSYIDHYNIKDYDITSGSFGDSITGFHTFIGPILSDPLTSRSTTGANQATRFLLTKGINANKINIGSPFYGRGFQVQPGTIDSMNGYMNAKGGLNNAPYEQDVFDYRNIKGTYLSAMPQNSFYNVAGQASYYYDKSSGTFISYESPTSAVEKVKFVKSNGLQGVFAWEFAGDTSDSELLMSLNQDPAI